MKLHDARQIDALGRLVLVAMILAFSALVSQQVVRPLVAARRDLGAFRNAVQILDRAEGSLERIDGEIRQATEEIAAGQALLPQALNLDDFVVRTAGLAREIGVRIEAITPQEVVEHRHYRERRIDLRVTGSCAALYAFLLRLEQGDQLSRVSELRLVGQEADARCALELQLALYFSPVEVA